MLIIALSTNGGIISCRATSHLILAYSESHLGATCVIGHMRGISTNDLQTVKNIRRRPMLIFLLPVRTR